MSSTCSAVNLSYGRRGHTPHLSLLQPSWPSLPFSKRSAHWPWLFSFPAFLQLQTSAWLSFSVGPQVQVAPPTGAFLTTPSEAHTPLCLVSSYVSQYQLNFLHKQRTIRIYNLLCIPCPPPLTTWLPWKQGSLLSCSLFIPTTESWQMVGPQ